MTENTTVVSPTKKPPHGMTREQRRIAEKAITRRYAQLSRALVAAKAEIETAVVEIPGDWEAKGFLWSDKDDDDVKASKFGDLKDRAVLLRREVADFKKKLSAARVRQEAANKKAQKKLDNLARQMADGKDEAIIRVNFNGQSDDMLAFLEGLPTTESLIGSLKKLKLPVPLDEKKLLSCGGAE